MYLRGRITINLAGTEIALQQPRNFFGGVANLLTKRSWQTKEELETYKLLAFAQSCNRALREVGVRDVVRIAIGSEVVYEDMIAPDDWDAALQALQERLDTGFEPDPHSDFAMVLKHDDGVLNYVINLHFVREHKVGEDPVSIEVTALPSDLRRSPEESEESFQQRVSIYFQTQNDFDAAQAKWNVQLQAFLNQIADHFRNSIGIENVSTDTRNIIPQQRDATAMTTYSTYGYPLYGYDPTYDLAYFMMWDSMWDRYRFRPHNVYYGDYGSTYVYVGDSGWGYDDGHHYDSAHPVTTAPSDAGSSSDWGAPAVGSSADWGSDSSGGDTGGSLVGNGSSTSSSLDSAGGGGWLSSVGDFFSSSGGGGDVSSSGDASSSSSSSSSSCSSSSSSCGGGGSSCGGGGGCGGGGCGSS